jgi:hypothetical protein
MLSKKTAESMKRAVHKAWLSERAIKCRFGVVIRKACSTRSALIDIRQGMGTGVNVLASYHAFERSDGAIEVEARG